MFFETKDSIPEGLGFSTFGGTHLIWLIVTVLMWAILILTTFRFICAE